MFFKSLVTCVAGVAVANFAALHADVTVPALFSDHAVLQKADKVPVWGKAAAGESVTVTLDKATTTAKAGDDGKWKALLDLHTEGPGPYTLTIKGSNQIIVADVLVGEVWLCGGQSNMEFPLGAFPIAKTEVPASANPLLRHFKVKFTPSPTPVDDVQGTWELADPKTTPRWTAVGYFYGKKLQGELGVPVGLVEDCIGGTMIETWMSPEALASDPDLAAGAKKAQDDRLAFDTYATQFAAWQKQYGREDTAPADPKAFAAPDANTSDWKVATLPGTFAASGLPDSGAFWIRKTIPVPGDPDIVANKGIDLYLGVIHDTDTVYWNGKKIGESGLTATNHRYGIRSSEVQAPQGVLAVRIFSASPGAGVVVGKGGNDWRFEGNHYLLKGDWQFKTEKELPLLTDEQKAALPPRPSVPFDPQNVAGYLYNGMINPVVSYGLRGVIWYQGEGNYNHGFQYRTEFPELIKDWRAKWGQGDFPFYFCQIANNHPHATTPGNDYGAELREGQDQGLTQPNTGEAILIDIGDELNIHPADKLDVGDRLARIALAKTYGKTVVPSGPVYDSMAVEGDKIRVKFKDTDGGLVAKPLPATYQITGSDPKTAPVVRNTPDSQIEGFSISGDDKKWHWASAQIDGTSVLVSSPDVPKPVAVRYAWAFNPWCNLYNGADLPAGPFRTDQFPELSEKSRYGDPTK